MLASEHLRRWMWVACGLLGLVGVAAVAKDSHSTDHMESLTSGERSVRVAAVEHLIEQRKDTIAELTRVLNAKKKDADWLEPTTVPNVVMRVLGEMRAAEAVPAIVEWLVPPKEGYVVVLSSKRSPAANALVAIGLPSVPNVVSLLRGATDETTVHICVDVLVGILDAEGTSVVLAREEQGASTPEMKQNFRTAKEVLKDRHGKSDAKADQK